jgi:hypothetical protein
VTESVLETVFTTVHVAVVLILELAESIGDALTHAERVAHELTDKVPEVDTLKLTLGDCEPVTDVEPDALFCDEPEVEGEVKDVDDVDFETVADEDTHCEMLTVEVTVSDGEFDPEIEGVLEAVVQWDTEEDVVDDELGDELMDIDAVELDDKDKPLVPVSESDAL